MQPCRRRSQARPLPGPRNEGGGRAHPGVLMIRRSLSLSRVYLVWAMAMAMAGQPAGSWMAVASQQTAVWQQLACVAVHLVIPRLPMLAYAAQPRAPRLQVCSIQPMHVHVHGCSALVGACSRADQAIMCLRVRDSLRTAFKLKGLLLACTYCLPKGMHRSSIWCRHGHQCADNNMSACGPHRMQHLRIAAWLQRVCRPAVICTHGVVHNPPRVASIDVSTCVYIALRSKGSIVAAHAGCSLTSAACTHMHIISSILPLLITHAAVQAPPSQVALRSKR